MHPELNPVVDQGANTLSPLVDVEEISLNAFVTFIECSSEQAFVGLGDGSVQTHKMQATLDPVNKAGYSVEGLPICAHVNPINQSVLVGTDNSALLEIKDSLSTKARLDKGWIEQISVSPVGLIAFSSNKTCYVLKDSVQIYEIPQEEGTITGLQFSADGSKLAIARYGGVVLCDMADGKILEELEWKGAHLNMCWSPDGRYLVTATPDKEIHCWDMKTKGNFRMRGYPAKIRSLNWTADGKHLAAAGADSVTVWPFVNGNPSGKPPYEFGYSFKGIVTEVAAHPTETIIAAGYNNGTVLIGRYLKGEAIIARAPRGLAISAMTWSNDGKSLYVGTEAGEFSRMNLKSFDF